MLDNDVQQVQTLKEELLSMKERYKDAINNKKLYEECLAKSADNSEYLDVFKRVTCYFLDLEGF